MLPAFPLPDRTSELGTAMQANDVQPLTTNPRGGRLLSVFPIACLAIGGLLTLAWSCALALCTYNIVCWLFEVDVSGR
jgi:hypothetical protein